MKYSKAVEIMMQLKAEYFHLFRDMPEDLFKKKVENFYNNLKDYSDKEIDIAFGFVLKECKTVPTTAHFVEILERNKELLLPSVEEEWNKVKIVIDEMATRRRNFDPSYHDWDKHFEAQRKSYNTLSQDVKDYYINFNGFYEITDSQRLDIERNKFIKQFPVFRKDKRTREQLLKKEGNGNDGT